MELHIVIYLMHQVRESIKIEAMQSKGNQGVLFIRGVNSWPTAVMAVLAHPDVRHNEETARSPMKEVCPNNLQTKQNNEILYFLLSTCLQKTIHAAKFTVTE